MKSCLTKDMNVGFLGASKIGRKMARAISLIDGFKLYSVAARDINRANEYKEETKESIKKCYELINNVNEKELLLTKLLPAKLINCELFMLPLFSSSL